MDVEKLQAEIKRQNKTRITTYASSDGYLKIWNCGKLERKRVAFPRADQRRSLLIYERRRENIVECAK